jgi:hypothetical protein
MSGEVIEHAHMHQKMAHGVKDILPDLEEKIKANIRPIKPGDPRATKKSSLLGTCY